MKWFLSGNRNKNGKLLDARIYLFPHFETTIKLNIHFYNIKHLVIAVQIITITDYNNISYEHKTKTKQFRTAEKNTFHHGQFTISSELITYCLIVVTF